MTEIDQVNWRYHKSREMLEIECGNDSHYSGVKAFLEASGKPEGKFRRNYGRGKEAAYETAEDRAEHAEEKPRPDLDFSAIKFDEKNKRIEISGTQNIEALVRRIAGNKTVLGKLLRQGVPLAQKMAAAGESLSRRDLSPGFHAAAVKAGGTEYAPREFTERPEQWTLFEVPKPPSDEISGFDPVGREPEHKASSRKKGAARH
jgi:hypothetical protein